MHVTKPLFFLFAVIVLLAPLSFAPSLRAQEQEPEFEVLPNPVVAPSDSGAYHTINQLPESIRRSAPFAREFYEFARHAGTSGVVDNDAYLSTFQEAQQDMLRASDRNAKNGFSAQATEGTWSNIGLVGNDTSNTPSAGITSAIAFDPQHQNVMYAGGSGGGVWKSTDTGANWFELTDNVLPNLSIATIAVDPVTPSTIYVGTGYCFPNGIPNYNGSGLYQSTDGGGSFQRLNVPGGSQSFVKVVVDPNNHTVVLASVFGTTSNAQNSGPVYRSTDAGTTWTSVYSGFAWDIVAVPEVPNTFYLFSGGVYKSTNDGVSWTKLTVTGLPGSVGRAELASPTKAPNKVFAFMCDANGNNAYLFESMDTGKTWVTLPVPGTSIFNPLTTNPQGTYDQYLGVSPNSTQSDTIYVGGVGAEYIYGTDAEIQQGSVGWTSFSGYPSGSGGNGATHVDHHSFAISPTNSTILYDGDDGGLWVNYAAGSTDPSVGGGWQLHSSQMITNRFYHLSLDRNVSSVTWAGAQDQGLWKLNNGQAPAQYAPLGDAMDAAVSPQSSNHVYAIGPEGAMYQATLPGSWNPTADTVEGVNDPCGWDNPIKMSPVSNGSISAASIIYVGRSHVWQTTNGGTNWKKLSPTFGYVDGGLSYCTAIGLPNWNANMIYTAGGGNSLELSTDFGVSWRSRTNPGYVTSINTSWQNTKFIVVSLSNGTKKVMMSLDSGVTWTDRSGMPGANIPGADTNSICNVMALSVDSSNPLSTWYAATDFGVYQTNDTGNHWIFMGPGLIPCRDITIATNKTTMRVATFGRGIWEVTLPIVFSGVETTSLTATKTTAGTNLAWNVENEPTGSMFYVERSLDGNAFARVDSVAGSGASASSQNYTFTDPVTAPGTYLYQIHEIGASGAQSYSNKVELHYGTNGLYLYQPYPNPFVLGGNSASAVTLDFELPAMDIVQLRIYDVKGMLIRTLLNKSLDGGPQSAVWDARDDAGNPVQPGAYFYTIQTANSGMASGKIMVVRE